MDMEDWKAAVMDDRRKQTQILETIMYTLSSINASLVGVNGSLARIADAMGRPGSPDAMAMGMIPEPDKWDKEKEQEVLMRQLMDMGRADAKLEAEVNAPEPLPAPRTAPPRTRPD